MRLFGYQLNAKFAFFSGALVVVLLLASWFFLADSYAVYSDGNVRTYVKIANAQSGFTETLDDGDQFGIAVHDIGDLDDDGVSDLIVGSWKDDDGGTNFGAAYILFMNADGTVDDSQKISMSAGGFTGPIDSADDFGEAVAGIGDLDGDEIEDVVIGERANDNGGTDRGAMYVLFLNADGTVKAEQRVSDTAGNFLAAFRNFDNFGGCIEVIDDINGDEIDDLAVCAAGLDYVDGVVQGTTTDTGGVYELEMNTDGTVQAFHTVGDGGQGFSDSLIDTSDKFGSAVAVIPDLNGDGIDDWAVGAPLDDDGAAEAGAVYILFMNADGTVESETKISSLTANFTGLLDSGDRFGNSIDSMGDLDRDGVSDILVGAWQDDDGGTNRGSAYIIFLNSDGSVKDYQKISDTAGDFEGTIDDSDQIGFSIAAVNDLNDDGFKEVAIGSFGDDDGGTDRGAVWLMFLNVFYPTNVSFVVPTDVSVVIADGSTCSASTSVELTLAGKDVQDYIVGNEAEFLGQQWTAFGGASELVIDWELTRGDGEKTVYARFRSNTRNQSSTVSDTIALDANCGAAEPPAQEPADESFVLPEFGPSPITGEEEAISFVQPGELVRGDSYDTVYYLDANYSRHPFLNEQMFFTWYDSFDTVKTVTDATLTVLPLGVPMNVSPETVLVKFATAPGVFYPKFDDVITWRRITSETVAAQIFGAAWADYVIDIPEVFYPHVTYGEDIDSKFDISVDLSKLKRREDL